MTNKQVPLPVHEKKKDTATHSTDSTPVQPPPSFPDQQEFQPHLRELARGAIRLVLEAVMREELDALVGVAWGESSQQQQGISHRLSHPQVGHDDGRIEALQVRRRSRGPVPHLGLRALPPL